MELLNKVVRKIKEGMLKEMYRELLWIYQYGIKYKWIIVLYIFFGIFGTVLGLGSSVMSKYVIDAVTGFNTSSLLNLASIYIAMRLVRIGADAWMSLISAKMEIKINHEIKADIYEKIMKTDWQAMSDFHSGDLISRMNGDAGTVASSVLGWVPDFITRFVQFCGAFGIIIYYDTTLAVLALLSAPVTFMVSRTVTQRMRRYNKKMREMNAEMMTFHDESFHNIQIIKSFGLTELYGRKLRDVQNKYRDVRLEYNKYAVETTSIMSVVGTIVSIVCFCWGVYRLWGGYITYGTMTLFLQMAGSLAGSFQSLVHMIPTAISAATAAGRIMAVYELPAEVYNNKAEVNQLLKKNQGIEIKAKDITFAYNGGDVVIENSNFTASPGEIIALVGPSGEGKTTMLRILLGIVSVQKGSVMISGDDIEIPVSASCRKLCAYVPQTNTMFAGTIAENLRNMKQDATDEELMHVLEMACAANFVKKLPEGLNSRIRERGCGFSEGQIQRLSIARALLADTPILLLDEATSALDVATERRVLRNIMHADKNKTCIVTTHRPSVLGVCNRVYRVSERTLTVVDEKEIQQMMMDF